MEITRTYDDTSNSTNFAVGLTFLNEVKKFGDIAYGLLFTFERGQSIPKLQLILDGKLVEIKNEDWATKKTFKIYSFGLIRCVSREEIPIFIQGKLM